MIARRIFALCSIALCAINSACSAVALAVERAVAFAFSVLATKPAAIQPAFGRLAVAGNSPSYDVPPAHALRHEAGTSRRSAARNI